MLTLSRILAPTDLSEASEASLLRAADLAARTGAELHVLHVVPGVSPDVDFSELSDSDRTLLKSFLEEAEQRLKRQCESLPSQSVPVKRVVSKGVPARVLLDYAEHEGIDLVVMGTHGRRGLRRLFLGSTAEEVLRHTTVPTLVVPKDASTSPIRHVLAPTDFSDVAQLALPVAAEFAALHHAALTLVHVLEPMPLLDTVGGAEFTYDFLPDLSAQVEQRLDRLADASVLTDVYQGDVDEPVEGRGAATTRIGRCVLHGRAAESIVEAADERAAHVIVMAKHGLHGVKRFLLGSVTERVCRLTSFPVLVIPIDERD